VTLIFLCVDLSVCKVAATPRLKVTTHHGFFLSKSCPDGRKKIEAIFSLGVPQPATDPSNYDATISFS
jgi:hypothetical protein